MGILRFIRPRIAILKEVAEEENEKNRNVGELCSGVQFMKENKSFSTYTLISGGSQTDRFWPEYNRIADALRHKYSVAALICPEEDGSVFTMEECGDSDGQLQPVCFQDRTQFGFDPILSEDHRMLATVLGQVSASVSGANGAKSNYWRFVLDFLTEAHGHADLAHLLDLDHQKMMDAINDLYGSGKLSAQAYNGFCSRYDQELEAQCAAANDLCTELAPMRTALRKKNVSMDDLHKRQGLLILDSIPKGSAACINLIMLLVKNASLHGRMVLMTDNVGCAEDDLQRRTILESADAKLPMILGGDLPTLMGSLFDTLVAHKCHKFVFSHTSGISAEQWSKHFGTYSKKIVDYTHTDNQSNTAVVEKNLGDDVTVRTDENARKITIDDLQKLEAGQAYVQIPGQARIHHLKCPRITLSRMKEKLC